MKKIETIAIDVGETPQGTLTMATHAPRKVIRAKVVRAAHWRAIMAVVRAVEESDKRFPFAQGKPVQALEKLRATLTVSGDRNG